MNIYAMESGSSLALKSLSLVFLFLIGLLLSGWAWGSTQILVLQSHDSPPYQQTLEGFKASLLAYGVEADYQIRIVSNDAQARELWPLILKSPPQLILTLGSPAMRAVLNHEQSIPVVTGLVLDTDELKKYPNATGIGLNFSAASYWLWLRRLLPDAHQISVIYDPRHGAALFQSLQALAHADNVTLIPAPASDPEELATLMQNLPAQLDAIWTIDCAAAFNSAATRELLLYSFRNRTPLIGLSAQWVKAGAFYALDWDYADLGAQSAELAVSILKKGVKPTALPAHEPRKVRPIFNSKTAEYMKLQVSEHWLPEIDEVFQ